MLHSTMSPKGVLRGDHLLLLDEELATLPMTDLRTVIEDIIESLQLISRTDTERLERFQQSDFLDKSIQETYRLLRDVVPVAAK